MKNKIMTRRQFLQVASLAALGSIGACASPPIPQTETPSWKPINPTPSIDLAAVQTAIATPLDAPTPASKKRALRIAHLTDIHVQPEGIAPEGMARALRHAQSQAYPPDIIFNTGDSIMESLAAGKARTEAQWDVFNNILAAECKLPIIHAIGNHDVWGWDTQNAQIKNDPLYGKGMAVERLGISDRYYSFDRAGWHFVVLDSTHLPNAVSQQPYIGKLDDEQFQWLTQDIQSVPGDIPICILSHIPILAACEYFDGPNEASGNWVVPAAWMHIDARQFRQFFLGHPNIRLCLSGHTHQREALDYLGVQYQTNGAVCGNWWNGAYLDFPPAYVMVDLYEDGSCDSLFVPL